ncbi:MBL fold metallo-hydrolase [Pendulispora albinea]|uniref:MBL fold metallo-hydrolase n=1 Tax=Pendulispora albinea TaxID=2741071 RepID=A0ABZ2M3G8_9BACT
MNEKKRAMCFAALVGVLASSGCASAEHAPKGAGGAGGANGTDTMDVVDVTEVQLIRSATVAIHYRSAGRRNIKILVDPILGDPNTEPAIDYSNGIKIPMIPLLIDKRQLIADIDAVLLTHYHPDHFDGEAERILPKDTLIFCQPYDEARLREKGFSNLRVVDKESRWEGITISRFLATHYKGATGAPPFGESSSFLLRTRNNGVFFTGDAILDDRLRGHLRATHPETIVANTGECQFTKDNPVLMPGVTMTLTSAELAEMARSLPSSTIVAVHMDAINHCPLTKRDLRRFVDANGLRDHIRVPNEGDVLVARAGAPSK